jgi:hypothetical protein
MLLEFPLYIKDVGVIYSLYEYVETIKKWNGKRIVYQSFYPVSEIKRRIPSFSNTIVNKILITTTGYESYDVLRHLVNEYEIIHVILLENRRDYTLRWVFPLKHGFKSDDIKTTVNQVFTKIIGLMSFIDIEGWNKRKNLKILINDSMEIVIQAVKSYNMESNNYITPFTANDVISEVIMDSTKLPFGSIKFKGSKYIDEVLV